jgi:oxygen-dependent protoporphyrinogen oxidase
VDYGAEVREVLVTAEGARVQTQDSEYNACCVVLAVPGARAQELLPGADAPTAALLGTPYSPALLIGLSLRRSLRPEEFEGAYGVLFHPADQPVVAAAAVFSRANHTGRPDADVLTVMFSPEAARRLRDAPEAEVKAEAVQALRAHLPPLERLVTGTRVVRWDQAMPLTPIDQAARVKDYRDHLPPGSRLVLAGDYLGFPWSDSAAYNGRWAARHLLESGSPVTSQ